MFFSQQKTYMNMKASRERKAALAAAQKAAQEQVPTVSNEEVKIIIKKPLKIRSVDWDPTIAWWMRVAPRRQSTIQQCISSFRSVFWDAYINLYIEPEDQANKYNFEKMKLWNVWYHRNTKTLWDVGNYHRALEDMLQWTDSDYIAIIEDDWIFSPDAKDVIMKWLKKLQWWFWYMSLSTDWCSGHYITKDWWNDISINGDNRVWRWLTGNVYLFPRDVVRQILDHHFYINHNLWYKKKNASDCMVAETVKQLWYKTLYHNPSLAAHIWIHSTLGHDADNWKVTKHNRFFGKTILPKNRKVVWIATIPQREIFLERVVNSLINQVDEINVWLNNYEHIPEYLLNNPKIRPIMLDNKRWDAAKYFFVHEVDWYYFTCDDDLEYPPDYVDTMIKRIDKLWKDSCIVSVHWHSFRKILGPVNVHRDMDHYYYFNDLVSNEAKRAHVVGTGVAAFHSDALILHYQDFLEPNKADEQMSVFTRIQWVQPYVIPHKWNWVKNLDPNEDTPALWRSTNWERRLHRYQKNLFPILRTWKWR